LVVSSLERNPPESEKGRRYGEFAVVCDRVKSLNLGKQFPAEGLLRGLAFQPGRPIKYGASIGQSLQTLRVHSQKGEPLAAWGSILSEEITARRKGLLMHLRLDSPTGPDVPTPAKALEQIHTRLADQQALWAEQLARDPAAFARLEPQIHQAFGQLADQLVASLLAHAAGQQPLADAAQKK
jgi:hypothetical protein